MPGLNTNNYPNIGRVVLGKDLNFYQKITVSTNVFSGNTIDGYQPDLCIPFAAHNVFFQNEGTTGTQVVGFSFNGTTLHGEMNPLMPSRSLWMFNRQICKVWFQLQPGSSGSVVVDVMAW